MDRTFSSDVIKAILAREGGSIAGIPGLAKQYVDGAQRVPGAPQIEDLKPSDVPGIMAVLTFQPNPDKDWNGLLARVSESDEFERNANNPYYPRWFGKTEDKPSMWVSDTAEGGEIDAISQKRIDQLAYVWQRPLSGDPFEMLGAAPCSDPEIMREIVRALSHYLKILLRPLGYDTGKNTEFRWCTTLPIITSLGFDAFRELSKLISEHSEDAPEFAAWAKATDVELGTDMAKAAEISGYPINLGHWDCTDLLRIVERVKMTDAPRWLPSMALLHIMKHTRFYPNLDGKPCLFVAYRGSHALVELEPAGLPLPLGDPINRHALQAVQRVLQISGGAGKKRTVLEVCIAGVFNKIHPDHITRTIPLYKRPDIVVAPAVTIKQENEVAVERGRKWIDPGLTIHNLAVFNPETGILNKTASIKGELALSLAWPFAGKMTDSELTQWLYELPTQIFPCLPADLIFAWIRNVNSLGHPRGAIHGLNGFMVMNMIRHQLEGTKLGGMADKEYPALWALPLGSTREETTKQGKTNFCRVLANILVPGLRETVCPATVSAPSQRSAASSIEINGTSIYDEFVPPTDPQHFLSPTGFVSLCTGGTVNPGRAMENATGVKLKYPLFFAAKIGPDFEDMVNRSLMFFLDTLNDDNRSTADEVGLIFSGTAATVIRLSAQLWLYRTKAVEMIRNLKPETDSSWRFPAHAAVIKLLAGEEYPEFHAYMKAAEQMCREQREHALDEDLPEALGYRTPFRPEWYWQNCQESTLAALKYKCKQGKPIRLLEIIRDLVEDSGLRNFDTEVTKKKTTESGAAQALAKSLKEKPDRCYVRGKFKLTLSDEKVRTESRNLVKAGVITEEGGIDPVMIPGVNAPLAPKQ